MERKTKILKNVWTGSIILAAAILAVLSFLKGFSLSEYFTSYYSLFIVLMCLAFFAEYIDSSLGMGYGTTLTPLLIILGFSPLQVVPAILFSEFISGITAGVLHHKADNVDFIKDKKAGKVMTVMTICSVAGVLLAVVLALNLPKNIIKLYIGAMILSIGIFLALSRKAVARFSWPKIIGLGALAAFNKGISGGGYGPLLTGGQLLSGIKEKNAVAITSMTEGLVCFIGILIYLCAGTMIYWPLAFPLTLGAFISVPAAVWTVKILPAKDIRGKIAYVTLFLGLLTIAKIMF